MQPQSYRRLYRDMIPSLYAPRKTNTPVTSVQRPRQYEVGHWVIHRETEVSDGVRSIIRDVYGIDPRTTSAAPSYLLHTLASLVCDPWYYHPVTHKSQLRYQPSVSVYFITRFSNLEMIHENVGVSNLSLLIVDALPLDSLLTRP